MRFMKENSPPCNTKDADVCDNEHHTVGENCFKVLEKHGKFDLNGVEYFSLKC